MRERGKPSKSNYGGVKSLGAVFLLSSCCWFFYVFMLNIGRLYVWTRLKSLLVLVFFRVLFPIE